MKNIIGLCSIMICLAGCQCKCSDTKDEEQREYGRSYVDSLIVKESNDSYT